MDKTPWHFLAAGLGAVAGLIGGFFGGEWLVRHSADPLLITGGIVLGTIVGGVLSAWLGLKFVDFVIFLHIMRENRRRTRERRTSPNTIRDSLDLDR